MGVRPTSAEAEWAMKALLIDLLGDAAGGVEVKALEKRPADPVNIRRIRLAGGEKAIAKLNAELDRIGDGEMAPSSIWAKMTTATEARVRKARGVADRSSNPEHTAAAREAKARRRGK